MTFERRVIGRTSAPYLWPHVSELSNFLLMEPVKSYSQVVEFSMPSVKLLAKQVYRFYYCLSHSQYVMTNR